MTTLPLASLLPESFLAEFRFEASMIGILIPIAGLLFAFGIVVAGLTSEANKRRLRHETIRHALDKGQPVPPELFRESIRDKDSSGPKPDRPRNDRRAGILTVAASIGIFVFLTAMRVGDAAFCAVIPFAVGLALLLNASLDEADRRKQDAAARRHGDDPSAR